MQRMGIYIHIPFCVRKCRYCDFLSFPAAEREKDRYVQALLEEIRREAERYQDAVVDSVFIGGGTPTVLAEGALEGILACLRASFHFADEAGAEDLRIAENDGDEPGQGKPFGMGTEARQVEITVEINPATAGRERLERLRLAGVNRLSIGTQSVHNRELAYLGRVHSAQDFFRIYRDAVEAGFDNINVDLMSGIPGQSIKSWRQTLSRVMGLEPEHISAYSLIIEEGTPFAQRELDLPGEEEEREMYESTSWILGQKGYVQYEISNYARPGRACAHNIGYWTRDHYLGLGLGAASLMDEMRWNNTDLIEEYLACASNPDRLHVHVEELPVAEQMEEMMFLGLRMMAGVRRQDFHAHIPAGLDIF